MLLRRHPHQLDLPKLRSDHLEFSFRYRAVKLWNALPEHIVAATSITTFKHLLLPHLCNNVFACYVINMYLRVCSELVSCTFSYGLLGLHTFVT